VCFSKPSMPSVPSTPPVQLPQEAKTPDTLYEQAKKQNKAQASFGSTLLTGPSGVDMSSTSTGKTLLGQ